MYLVTSNPAFLNHVFRRIWRMLVIRREPCKRARARALVAQHYFIAITCSTN